MMQYDDGPGEIPSPGEGGGKEGDDNDDICSVPEWGKGGRDPEILLSRETQCFGYTHWHLLLRVRLILVFACAATIAIFSSPFLYYLSLCCRVQKYLTVFTSNNACNQEGGEDLLPAILGCRRST